MPLVKLGQPINLNASLGERETDKFVRAFLEDSDGNDLGSVDLVHNRNGLYQNDSVLMPNTQEVTATFVVYDDAAYTEETCKYPSGFEVFTLFEQETTQVVNGSNCEPDMLEGAIQDSGLIEGKIIDNNQMIFGFVENNDSILQGLIHDSKHIIGLLESDQYILEGSIKEDEENLSGEIYC